MHHNLIAFSGGLELMSSIIIIIIIIAIIIAVGSGHGDR